MYKLDYTEEAKQGMQKLKRSEPQSFQKLTDMLSELMLHPRTGTGHPEQLRGEPQGRWSRRISKKHRLVYHIFDEDVVVLLLSAYGHYDDK